MRDCLWRSSAWGAAVLLGGGLILASSCATTSPFAGLDEADPCATVRSAAPPFDTADVARGAAVFERECAQCHSVSPDRNRLPGPQLHAVVSRPIGKPEGFRYSAALRDHGGTWTFEALDRYIDDPAWFIPETRMNYAGLKDPAERLDVLAYLACPAEEAPAPHSFPGANAAFESEDVDVERFVGVLEGESREVFVNREAIVAAIGIEPGDAVADVGAGTGIFLEPFHAATGPEGRVYAVEIAPKFVAHLEARAEREGLDRVEVVTSTAKSAELAPRSVDVAFVCDTYHHFEYPRETLLSLRQALRPGGELVVVDFERIEGKTRQWMLDHMRAGKEVFVREITAAGFELVEEVEVPQLEENYVLRFRVP